VAGRPRRRDADPRWYGHSKAHAKAARKGWRGRKGKGSKRSRRRDPIIVAADPRHYGRHYDPRREGKARRSRAAKRGWAKRKGRHDPRRESKAARSRAARRGWRHRGR